MSQVADIGRECSFILNLEQKKNKIVAKLGWVEGVALCCINMYIHRSSVPGVSRRGGGEVSEEAICLSAHAPSAPTDIDLVLGTQLLLSSEVEEKQDG